MGEALQVPRGEHTQHSHESPLNGTQTKFSSSEEAREMVTPRDRVVILQKQPGNPIAQFFLLLPMARSKTWIPLCFALQRFTPVTSMFGASVAVLMHKMS